MGEGTKPSPTPDITEEDQEIVEEYLSSQIIEASMHYAMGAYITFCRLKGLQPEDSNILVAEMGQAPEGLDTPQKRSEYFLGLGNSVGEFLAWFVTSE